MNIIIKKFGGTSVSSLERIERAVSYIKKSRKQGFKVVIVVSAMGKETDRLLNLTSDLDIYEKSDDIANLLWNRKSEWLYLDFFEQTKWRTDFFGLSPEKFKNVIWEE